MVSKRHFRRLQRQEQLVVNHCVAIFFVLALNRFLISQMHCICPAPHETTEVIFSFSCNWHCEKSLFKIVWCSHLRTHKSIETWTFSWVTDDGPRDLDCHRRPEAALANQQSGTARKFSERILRYCALLFLIHVKDCIVACWTEGVKWKRCCHGEAESSRRGWNGCEDNIRLDRKLSLLNYYHTSYFLTRCLVLYHNHYFCHVDWQMLSGIVFTTLRPCSTLLGNANKQWPVWKTS